MRACIKKNDIEIGEKIFGSGTFQVGRSATANKQYPTSIFLST
jgi:hypothetical protein